MDEIEKLLRKTKKADREKLLSALQSLMSGDLVGMQVKKLAGSKLYRIRVGNFRIIFSVDPHNTLIIESVRRRNE